MGGDVCHAAGVCSEGAHDRWAIQLLSWASPTCFSSQVSRTGAGACTSLWWTPESGLCAPPRRCGDTRHHGWAPKTHRINVSLLPEVLARLWLVGAGELHSSTLVLRSIACKPFRLRPMKPWK